MTKPLYYLRCLFCRARYSSPRRERLCPSCWSEGRVYGVKENPAMGEDDDTEFFIAI